MDQATTWRDAARTIKHRIQGAVTVAAWYLSYVTILAFIDAEALSILERNEWLGAIAVVCWLAAGAAVGQAAAWATFRGLPDPETAS